MYVKAFRQWDSFIALNLTAAAKRGWLNLKFYTWQVSWRLLWVHCHQTKQQGELRTSKEMCVSGQKFRHKDIKDFLSLVQSRVGRVPILTAPEWVKRCVTVYLTQADALNDGPVIIHNLARMLSVLSQTSFRDMTSQHNKPPEVYVYGRAAEQQDFCSQRYKLHKYKQLDIRIIIASVRKLNPNVQKSQLLMSGYMLLSLGRLRGACDSSSGTSGFIILIYSFCLCEGG